MSPIVVFGISMAIFLLLAFLGMPIAFAFAIIGFVGMVLIKDIGPALSTLGAAPWQWASNPTLVVAPLFILMGQFAFQSGISGELFSAAYKWMGRLPGGLALATNLACTGFAACTGSSIASGATFAMIAYPEMERFNYSRRLATGCIAAGGTLGILIPPSIIFVIYGVITNQSIGKLFIAGILPGLLLSGLFLTIILVMCLRNPKLGPRGEIFSLREKLRSLSGIWGMLLIFMVIIGGLYFGVFTPSEAGAAGAFATFLICLVRRKATLRGTMDSLKSSAHLTVMILTILIGAMIFSTFLSVSGVPSLLSEWIGGLPLPPMAILLIILAMYIPLGMFMDSMAMLLLTIPIIFPVIVNLGFDPIWFGVLIVLLFELALITPPIGMGVFVIQGITKVPLQEVFLGSLPFVIAMIACLALLVAFPQIALLLPSTMME